jgi:hypothetical protein
MSSSSSTIYSLASAIPTAAVEVHPGPSTVFIGVRSSCNVSGLPSSTKPACTFPGGTPFAVAAGQIDVNTNTETTINTATTITNITTLTQVYEIDGTACQVSAAGQLSALVRDSNVIAYIPKGTWVPVGDAKVTKVGAAVVNNGVAVVNVEGNAIPPNTLIPTGTDVINSCASNALTGQTVCTANGNDVYFTLPPNLTAFATPMASDGKGSILFSDGSCTNCVVAMDSHHNRAVIGLSLGGTPGKLDGKPGFQFLDLGASPSFEKPAHPSAAGQISEGFPIDPNRNVLLSPTEGSPPSPTGDLASPQVGGNFEIVTISNSSNPGFFEFENEAVPLPLCLDSAGEDCSTGIVLAPVEFSSPGAVFIADLTQHTATPGTPGIWTAPALLQTLKDSFPEGGTGPVAIAQGTHTGVMAGEFGDTDKLTAIALPATSGTEITGIRDWVTCKIGNGFNGSGGDPHSVTAYQSPKGAKDAIALIESGDTSQLAVIDLTQMLNKTIVRRSEDGHACAGEPSPGPLPAALLKIIPLPPLLTK